MLDQEKILNLIKTTGPTLPSKVAKIIKTDILLASAHLADLVSQGKIKISNLKIGASPLYYLLGQEDQLYPFAAGNINPKDQGVLEILKNNKVLRETELDLLSKVALRSLKDFAVPLRVTVDDNKEIFWKWHLLDDEKTNKIIRSILTPPQPIQKEVSFEDIKLKKVIKEEFSKEEIKKLVEQKEEILKVKIEENEHKKIKSKELQQVQRESELKEKSKILGNDDSNKDNLKPKLRKINNKEKQKKLSDKIEKEEIEVTKELIKPKKKLEVKISKEIEKNEDNQIKGVKEIKDDVNKLKTRSSSDNFLPTIKSFLNGLEIDIEQEEIIRKNSEINLILNVSTVIGKLTYYCKAKSKKKCDEKDLSSAYMEAQIKKLPLLFLYSYDLNKKAQEMLESGAFQNVTVKKID